MRRIGRTIALGILVVAPLASESRWGRLGHRRLQASTPVSSPRTFPAHQPLRRSARSSAAESDLGRPNLRQSKSDSYQVPRLLLPGAVLDPTRLLVGSVSNFGAPLPASGGQKVRSCRSTQAAPARWSFRPISTAWRPGGDPRRRRADVQREQPTLAQWRQQPGRSTAQYTGVGNPLGLSNNNGFGRSGRPIRHSAGRIGSSSILDPTGLPLNGAPNPLIGGVYVGDLTNRNFVANPAQRRSFQAA